MKTRKLVALLIVLALTFSLAACSSGSGSSASEAPASPAADGTASSEQPSSDNSDILIGVSIWSSTDSLGSQCKQIIDAAADALGVKVMYVDQSHISEQVTASVETLAAAGCQGIIICNSSSAEMTSVINTCNQYKIYCSQFFRIIDKDVNPDEYEMACSSPYFIGAVHEDEVTNGYSLAQILCEKGYRKIAIEGWEAGDATFLLRWEGYKEGVDAWNKDHPDDQATLLDPEYGTESSDAGRATAEAIISANPDVDAIIVAGGGGGTLTGALAAIDGLGLTGKIGVVSTDFLDNLGDLLESGAMTAESGGHYCDPLFAFMMVYNAIKGNYSVPTDSFYDVNFPYLYVSSPEDYQSYEKYFVDSLPYTTDELKEIAGYSLDDLEDCAASLSIEDVQERHGG